VAVCTLAFVATVGSIVASLLEKDSAGVRDFVSYWAAGQQLVHHANPYDVDAVFRIERSVGFSGPAALVMGNAPPALLLVLPLGFLGPEAAELLWSLLSLCGLVASVRMTWTMLGRPGSRLYVLGYAFAPALLCLLVGQTSLFVLLGLVLFLRLHRTRPYLAGASLWLCALKPQLFLPFGLVLLAWIIVTGGYKLLVGAVTALGLTTGIALILDPAVWRHYGRWMSVVRYDRALVPCISNVLRRSISPGAMWLEYVPLVIGCLWALAYFRSHRNDWDWMTHGSLLTLVSVLVSPYTWLVDQSILIPALLLGLYHARSRGLIALLALASATIEIAALRGLPPVHSNLYLWTAPAWLAWYLYATRIAGSENANDPRQILDGAQSVPRIAVDVSARPGAPQV
jgi:hypothetical protein